MWTRALLPVSVLALQIIKIDAFPLSENATIWSDGEAQNLTLQGGKELGLDPSFSMEASKPGKDRLNSLSSYMLTLLSLHDLALQDFKGDIIQAERWSPAPWADTSITIIPRTQFRLPRRFVVWGLYQALNHFLEQGNAFFETQFFLCYKGIRIGQIDYKATKSTPKDDDGENLASANDTVTSFSTAADISPFTTPTPAFLNKNTVATSISITSSFVPNARIIKKPPGIFTPLAAGLAHLAEQSATAKLDPFISDQPKFDTLLAVIYEGRGSGIRPPFFTVESGIEALWAMARFVARELQFREVAAVVRIQGYLVGNAVVKLHGNGLGDSGQQNVSATAVPATS